MRHAILFLKISILFSIPLLSTSLSFQKLRSLSNRQNFDSHQTSNAKTHIFHAGYGTKTLSGLSVHHKNPKLTLQSSNGKYDCSVEEPRWFNFDSASRRGFLSTASVTIFAGSAIMPANAVTTNNKGVVLPSEGEIESSIPSTWDDADNPFKDVSPKDTMFSRLDSSPDSVFYSDPRFVEHVDEEAVSKMTAYISKLLKPGDAVLDLCSSWTSHIDSSRDTAPGLKRVAGLGMNEKELVANPALTEWVVRDLNADPKLPFEDGSFDLVLCQLSIDYLTKPLDVMREVGRVLKPGGKVAVLFSNRLFLSKAVGLWTGADDIDHAYTVGSYLHYSNGGLEQIQAEDLSTRKGRGKNRPIVGDPLYVVTAIKR